MFRIQLPLFLIANLFASPAWAQVAVSSAYEDETAMRFSTSDVLPLEVLKGPGYELDPVTSVSDGQFVFRIHTTWGVLAAHGKPMLALRLREMYVIERARQMNREPQLIGSFLQTLVDSRKGARLLLTDPLGSVLRVPAGLERGLSELISPANRRSGGETRRRIAAELDCDPETTNPILSPLLDWIAVRQGVGGLAGKVGLNLVLPGLALIPTTAQFKEPLASESPATTSARIERELLALGFDPLEVRRFGQCKGLTTLQRLMVLEQLKPLAGINGHNLLLRRVADVEHTAQAMRVLHELVELNRLHQSRQIAGIVVLKYPVLTLGTGQHIVLCAADYLVFNQSLEQFCANCKAVLSVPKAELLGSVVLSEQASGALSGIGVQKVATSE